jgi:HlyD family secretion protein
MRFPIKSAVTVILLAGVCAASYKPLLAYWKERNRTNYRLATVSRGPIVSVVNSTGTVKPVLSVSVGSFVSGPIEALYVDFNEEVKKGHLLAKIDPRIYEAAVARDRAALNNQNAQVKRVAALLQQAKNDEARSQSLRAENKDFISDTEMDKYKFGRMSLEAELIVMESAVEMAEANLENSEANLGYTDILSPVDGIIIDRKIDPGQTLAAQFQTPELFVVAPDMRQKMHVFASVDEAEIGLIREAQDRKQPVHFTVDAYPDDLFEGEVYQIRKSSTTTQNVVTYPVVVAAPNPDLKLLPGMTATISFQVAETSDTLRIPNAALRFFPQREQVRPADRKLLDGENDAGDANDSVNVKSSATEKAKAARDRNRRHVWAVDGEFLKAVEVVTGISDHKFTELVSGDLAEGQELVTGIKPKDRAKTDSGARAEVSID